LVNRLYEERDKIIEDHQRLAMICDEKTIDNEKKTAIVGKLQMKLFMTLAELDRVTKGNLGIDKFGGDVNCMDTHGGMN